MTRALAFFLAASALLAADFPQAEISNGRVRATLYLPDPVRGYYRATRFDWSGVIASLEAAGHRYFGVWFPRYDPHHHDSITGPVEEFCTGTSALGYDEAAPGATFIRIGVGILRKPDAAPFNRFKTYEIVDPGRWVIHTRPDSVEFTHVLAGPASGYAYRYTKTVRLIRGKTRMVIEHRLKNTGTKPIETNVYNHEFFVIDNQPSGPDFSVSFPFTPRATGDFRGLVAVRGNRLVYLREIAPAASDWAQLQLTGFGSTPKDFDIRVENRRTGAGVRVRGDQPLWKIIFWTIRSTICPEAYVNFRIAPGKEARWRLVYDFYGLGQ